MCPKNLVSMWQDYRERYGLRGKVMSYTRVLQELPSLKRYRLVIIDESHNLRNREGRRYRAIYDYIQQNECRCVLLSATPYNKAFTDLSTQLRLFIPDDKDLGFRPDALLKSLGGEAEFTRQHQASVRSLAAFEKSNFPDDWRELMRHYMVRRTRSFIRDVYAEPDPDNGRKFLRFEDGTRSYFPDRIPKTIKFSDQREKSQGHLCEAVRSANCGSGEWSDGCPGTALGTTSQPPRIPRRPKPRHASCGTCPAPGAA